MTNEPVRMSEVATSTKRPDADFWKPKTLTELIKSQGVKPIKSDKDFDKIYGIYPEWDDIDEFLEEVHQPWP